MVRSVVAIFATHTHIDMCMRALYTYIFYCVSRVVFSRMQQVACCYCRSRSASRHLGARQRHALEGLPAQAVLLIIFSDMWSASPPLPSLDPELKGSPIGTLTKYIPGKPKGQKVGFGQLSVPELVVWIVGGLEVWGTFTMRTRDSNPQNTHPNHQLRVSC